MVFGFWFLGFSPKCHCHTTRGVNLTANNQQQKEGPTERRRILHRGENDIKKKKKVRGLGLVYICIAVVLISVRTYGRSPSKQPTAF